MAKEPKESPEDKSTTEAPKNSTETAEVNSPNEQSVHTTKVSKVPKLSASKWIIVAVVAFFAILGVTASSFAVLRLALHDGSDNGVTSQRYDGDSSYSRSDQTGSGFGGMRGNMMNGFSDRFSNSDSSSTRISGVVTAVDGDTITVAGDGTTTKVVVTSSTTYTGSSKPAAVNDTIMVTGTTSDGTLTATTVRLYRQS